MNLTTTDVARAFGLTYRQVDYLARTRMRPELAPGRGEHRVWNRDDVALLSLYAAACDLGVAHIEVDRALRHAPAPPVSSWTLATALVLGGQPAEDRTGPPLWITGPMLPVALASPGPGRIVLTAGAYLGARCPAALHDHDGTAAAADDPQGRAA